MNVIDQDKRTRRRLLRILHEGRSNPVGLNGRFIQDILRASAPPAERLDGEDERMMALMQDLIGGGYAVMLDQREKKHQQFSLDWISYAVTHKGSALIEQQIAADPLVEDDRR